VINARQMAKRQTTHQANQANASKQAEVRPMVQRSFDVDLGASKSMVLSFLLHGLLGVGLFAFDGLASKPWRQLGADASAPAFIEVEMLASQVKAKTSTPSHQRPKQQDDSNTVAVPKKDVPVEPDALASAANQTAAGSANSAGASSVSVSSAKLADAEMVYLNDLRKLLESKKEYPIAARRMGHRGRVVVRFVLERDGRVRTAEIVQGSQSEILNRAARGLIGRLHDVKPFPKEVALTEWAVVVPIEYQM
jgi:protein TonB